MPILQAQNLSYVFANGEVLFAGLSCSMEHRRVGLIGNNGAGKSVLAALLTGEKTPTSGTVSCNTPVGIYRQQPSELLAGDITIADYLGVSPVLTALARIMGGECEAALFETVGEQWHLPATLAEQLVQLGLPGEPQFPCAQLSGGQLAKLQLWKLFNAGKALLILDEPSNHLDSAGKQWLRDQLAQFSGAVLLISHDRALLVDMEAIWSLSDKGLAVFTGNYDDFREQQLIHQQAVNRQLASVEKQQKQLARQAQRNQEKAQQRAAQGNKLRKSGSQATCLLDVKKDRATASAAHRNKNDEARRVSLQSKANALRLRRESMPRQRLHLGDGGNHSRQVISLLHAQTVYGGHQPLSLQINANDKVLLAGNNGSGKSTVLKTLLGELPLIAGELSVNTALFYLDQHFAVVTPTLSLLDNMLSHCQGMQTGEARTLLAGIGFRRDSVFRLAGELSGGEKMKLAMLIVSHQADQPFLLLDEPDNHLDIASKEMLASALCHYAGGFILVSHDRYFAAEAGGHRVITLNTRTR